jgi:hypothetical protein
MVLSVAGLAGCATTRAEKPQEIPQVSHSATSIKVVRVTNDSGAISDVDVIGLLWDALEGSLKKKGLLWNRESPGQPFRLEAHIVQYQKGSAWERWLLPGFGSTILAVTCELKDGAQVIATVKSREKVATGDGLTIGAWKGIFSSVAEEVVIQIQSIINA